MISKQNGISSLDNRCYGLDFLKVIATMVIFFHHYQQVYEISFTNHINFFNGLIYWGRLVELFFVISGYVIYSNIKTIKEGAVSFGGWFGRRLRRILPLLATSIIINEILYMLYYGLTDQYWFYERPISLWGALISALGMHCGGAVYFTYVNNPSWYLSVLLICYVVFYITTRISKITGCKHCYLYFAVILIGIAGIDFDMKLPFWNMFVCRGYYAFFWGLLLAEYIHNFGIGKIEILLSVAALFVFGVLLIIAPAVAVADLNFTSTFILYTAIILIIESDAVKKLFRSSFWAEFAKVSFSVYVWHLPLLLASDVLCLIIGVQLDRSALWMMYLFLLLIEVFAVFSHNCIEKPLDKLWCIAEKRYAERRMANTKDQ